VASCALFRKECGRAQIVILEWFSRRLEGPGTAAANVFAFLLVFQLTRVLDG